MNGEKCLKPESMRRLLLPLLVLCQTGQGQVTFAPPKSIVPALSFMGDLRVHDVNADSYPDLIAVERNGEKTLTWLNDGLGNFSDPLEWSDPGPTDYLGFADWNQDGRLDLWLSATDLEDPANPSSRTILRVLVAPAIGAGEFGGRIVVGTMSNTTQSNFFGEPVLMDINLDGRADVITASAILLSNSTGGWTATGQGLPNPDSASLWFIINQPQGWDHDGDGDLDLFIQPDWDDSKVLYWENLGAGNFAAPVPLFAPATADHRREHFQLLPTSGGAVAIVVETHSSTGQSTVFRYSIDSALTLVPNGQFILPCTREGKSVGNTGVKLLAPDRAIAASYSGDLNRTYLDLIRFDGTPSVPAMTLSGVTTPELISLQNLNGDLHDDLLLGIPALAGLVGVSADQVHWIAMNASGVLTGGLREVHTSILQPKLLDCGDLNADGKPDIVVRSIRSGDIQGMDLLRFFSTDDAGVTWTESTTALDGNLQVVSRVDLVGTFLIMPAEYNVSAQAGKADFLVVKTRQGMSQFGWLIQDANRGFHFFPLTGSISELVHYPELLDWDGDDIRDIIFYEEGSTHHLIKWHKGTITGFLPAKDLTGLFNFPPAYIYFTADMDRDGDLDLLLQGNIFGQYSFFWMENNGSGNLIAARRLPQIIWTTGADFDRDTYLDFIGPGDDTGLSRILVSRPGPTLDIFGGSFAGSARFMDVDDDSDPDVITQSPIYNISIFTEMFWYENRGGGISNEPKTIDGPRDRYDSQLRFLDINQDGVADLVSISAGDGRIEWFRKSRVQAPSSFDAWMSASALSGNSAGPLADWDEDGASNWEEFAFGSHPAVRDPDHPGRPRMVHQPAGLAYRFQRRTDASAMALNYDVYRSNNLQDWFPWSPMPTVEAVSPGYEAVIYPVTPGEGSEFFRTRISDPPSP